MHKKIGLYLVLLVTMYTTATEAQTGLTKSFSEKRKKYIDSLKKVNYNYMFPILGQQAYSKGYDIPYPVGIMVNYFNATQSIVIENIQLGFEGPNKTVGPADFSGLIQFGDNKSHLYNFNIRPDVWVFPFLNVYGLFGYAPTVNTTVELKEPFYLKSSPKQSGLTYGFGIMTAMNAGPVFISVDFNQTWSQLQLLDKAVSSNILGLRVGHSFVFNSKPEKNLTFWMGAMRLGIRSETKGRIQVGEAIGDADQKFVDDVHASDWYNNLGPLRQEIVDQTLNSAVNKINDTYVVYSIDKHMKQQWSGCIGAQFQQNKRMIYRTEVNCIGDRFSVMLSYNYRVLGIKKKTK